MSKLVDEANEAAADILGSLGLKPKAPLPNGRSGEDFAEREARVGLAKAPPNAMGAKAFYADGTGFGTPEHSPEHPTWNWDGTGFGTADYPGAPQSPLPPLPRVSNADPGPIRLDLPIVPAPAISKRQVQENMNRLYHELRAKSIGLDGKPTTREPRRDRRR